MLLWQVLKQPVLRNHLTVNCTHPLPYGELFLDDPPSEKHPPLIYIKVSNLLLQSFKLLVKSNLDHLIFSRIIIHFISPENKIICDVCTIWYHLYNLRNVKNNHGGVLLSVKLQAACNFTKSNTPLWVFFTFFKLYKWKKITQRNTYCHFISPENTRKTENQNISAVFRRYKVGTLVKNGYIQCLYTMFILLLRMLIYIYIYIYIVINIINFTYGWSGESGEAWR